MKLSIFQVIITAVVAVLASFATYKGTRYTATSSKESAFAQVTPEMAEQIRDLLKESQDKNGQITTLTAQVKEQSRQLKEQSKIMSEQGNTIDALNSQIGSLRQQIEKMTGVVNHE